MNRLISLCGGLLTLVALGPALADRLGAQAAEELNLELDKMTSFEEI
jgi:hypothetical protein